MSASVHPARAETLVAELRIEAEGPAQRTGEPVTCGLPCPRHWLRDPAYLQLEDAQGRPVPLQARVLDGWPEGSIRWVLLDWQATLDGTATYRLSVAEKSRAVSESRLVVTSMPRGVLIDTGKARFEIWEEGRFPFSAMTQPGAPALPGMVVGARFRDEAGRNYTPTIISVAIEESGPLRASVRAEGSIGLPREGKLADFFMHLHFFAGAATVRCTLTLRNSRKAEHPGGLWDLGNGGSIYLREAALQFGLAESLDPVEIRFSTEPEVPLESCRSSLEIYQDSSGGENWRSSNHLNRHHVVPLAFRGYRTRADGTECTAHRATPVVALESGTAQVAVTLPYFWQNFPKAVEAADGVLTLSLFPRQSADCHELQGGEQKSHTFYIALARDNVTATPLAWARSPLLPHAAPAWYCDAIGPYLIPRERDPNTEYVQLVDAAIEGDDNFEHKREVIDEYGWRHFGEIYGDHEGVFHKGPTPLVSHYNNQYDPIAGFAYQYFRSADVRWWRAMSELTAHVIDIDVYHCYADKTAYNRGLFWHTYHYVDADTGTHRSYPRAAKVCGGGPSDEHNYTTGLMLYYFLTGDPAARRTATDLARWVIDVDDGNQSQFRWLDRGNTGLASSSGNPLYHGPGRGAGNSINALLDGHRLTGDRQFAAKAEELIRRCIHPADDIARHNLLDAERRWYYTVFLQALGKYLDYKALQDDLDFMYAYARAALLHYARWMADNEYPYLNRPEILEYPTETWPAQDMRKSEVFKYAGQHAAGGERGRFLERADFFFRYVTGTLSGMTTRSLCRPVVLLLSHGFMHGYYHEHPARTAPAPSGGGDFGQPETFIPQRVRALRRFKFLAASTVVLGLGAFLWALCRWLW